jgi:hypothetical protein
MSELQDQTIRKGKFEDLPTAQTLSTKAEVISALGAYFDVTDNLILTAIDKAMAGVREKLERDIPDDEFLYMLDGPNGQDYGYWHDRKNNIGPVQLHLQVNGIPYGFIHIIFRSDWNNEDEPFIDIHLNGPLPLEQETGQLGLPLSRKQPFHYRNLPHLQI